MKGSDLSSRTPSTRFRINSVRDLASSVSRLRVKMTIATLSVSVACFEIARMTTAGSYLFPAFSLTCEHNQKTIVDNELKRRAFALLRRGAAISPRSCSRNAGLVPIAVAATDLALSAMHRMDRNSRSHYDRSSGPGRYRASVCHSIAGNFSWQ